MSFNMTGPRVTGGKVKVQPIDHFFVFDENGELKAHITTPLGVPLTDGIKIFIWKICPKCGWRVETDTRI